VWTPDPALFCVLSVNVFHYIRLEYFFNWLSLNAPDKVAFHILSVLSGSVCFSVFVVALFIIILQAIVSALLSSTILDLLFGPLVFRYFVDDLTLYYICSVKVLETLYMLILVSTPLFSNNTSPKGLYTVQEIHRASE
jgi:hypothetical protein